MRILFDHQIFALQKYGGASKYFYEILSRLPSDSFDLSLLLSNNEYVRNLDVKYWNFLQNRNFYKKNFLMNNMNKFYSIFKIINEEYDVFHQTHFETYGLSFLKNKPLVITFHDMNHTKYPEMYQYNYFKKQGWIVTKQKECIDRADKIIAISEYTKNDLINIWGVDEKKIVIIHHGVSKMKEEVILERIIEQPYILYVGDRDGFKNFNFFASGISILFKEYKDLRLVCTGSSFRKSEVEFFKKNNIEKKIIHISATENEMASLYKNALFFVFPSISEGFGMPILESMSNECPVLLSNSSCFPEIAGDAGLYFNPFSLDELIYKMKIFIENESIRRHYIEIGKERVVKFSWEKSVKKHVEVYKNLL